MALKMTSSSAASRRAQRQNMDFEPPTTQVRMGMTSLGRLRPAGDDVGHGAVARREHRSAHAAEARC